MAKKAKQYNAAEKAKIVMEAIESELTIAQIISASFELEKYLYTSE